MALSALSELSILFPCVLDAELSSMCALDESSSIVTTSVKGSS